MIERLLAADDAFDRGELVLAERLFAQVADADVRNAIAVVGLARIAAQRGDLDGARASLRRALEIDPDEAAARRLLGELDAPSPPAPEPPREITIAPMPTAEAPTGEPARKPSLRDRILGWLGLSNRPG